jgi:NAD(P)-dependent dehydrogenase (short-subunit alcohol dehydrogenase family)
MVSGAVSREGGDGEKFKDKVVIVTVAVAASRHVPGFFPRGAAGGGQPQARDPRRSDYAVESEGGSAPAQAAQGLVDLDALIDAAYTHFGRVDVLVINAGINVAFGPLSRLLHSI